MHLPQVRVNDMIILCPDDITDVVMPMRWLSALRPSGNTVAVDVDGHPGYAMPWIDHEPVHPGFLHGLPQGGTRQIVRRLVMTARLQPAPEGAVMDQKDLLPAPVENERGGRDMAGKGAAGMNVIPARDLTPQESMPCIRHPEGSGVSVQNRAHMPAEGRKVEARG